MAVRKFAWIAEGDVFGVMTIPEEQNPEAAQRLIAGMSSNPIVVECTGTDVEHGWTWDGEAFSSPVV